MASDSKHSSIPPQALARIGTETTHELGVVSQRDILRYAVATNDRNPLYSDPEAAATTAYAGLIAPPAMASAVFWTTDGVFGDELNDDGLVRTEPGRIPLGPKRAMGGGQELEFLEPIRPGDALTRTDRVAEIYERESKLGTLIFTVVEQTFRNQRGEVVVKCRSTSILH